MKFRGPQLVIVVVVAMLVAAPLVASLYHHHAGSSDTNCPVCHFNHQPMDRPVASGRLPSFDVIQERPFPVEAQVVAARTAPPLPSRAPPVA